MVLGILLLLPVYALVTTMLSLLLLVKEQITQSQMYKDSCQHLRLTLLKWWKQMGLS